MADAKGFKISERYVWDILHVEGFARLPRRSKKEKNNVVTYDKIKASISTRISFTPEIFNSENIGILCLIPYIKQYGLLVMTWDAIITEIVKAGQVLHKFIELSG